MKVFSGSSLSVITEHQYLFETQQILPISPPKLKKKKKGEWHERIHWQKYFRFLKNFIVINHLVLNFHQRLPQ